MLLGEGVAAARLVDRVAVDQREVEPEQRRRSPRTISSLMSRPAMIVLPAPGWSTSRNRSGWRGSISS